MNAKEVTVVTVKTSQSFPLLGSIGLIFITLKLCSMIQWSWWWVLAPFWAPLAVIAIALAGLALLAIGVAIVERRRRK